MAKKFINKKGLSSTTLKEEPCQIRRYIVNGSRRLSNYCWAGFIFLGSFCFLLTGLSSYFKFESLINNSLKIAFFPQGLVMSFYGLLGLLFSSYLWLTLLWNVGEGFNELNKKSGIVRIFRWGFPGKNRRIDVSYQIADIEAIKLELQNETSSRRTIYIGVKGFRDIPLSHPAQPTTLQEVEQQASELAQFLQVSLELI